MPIPDGIISQIRLESSITPELLMIMRLPKVHLVLLTDGNGVTNDAESAKQLLDVMVDAVCLSILKVNREALEDEKFLHKFHAVLEELRKKFSELGNDELPKLMDILAVLDEWYTKYVEEYYMPRNKGLEREIAVFGG